MYLHLNDEAYLRKFHKFPVVTKQDSGVLNEVLCHW